MPDISNTFVSGIMNKDLDDRLVPNGTFRDALNIDVDTSSSGNVGMAQNVMGNVLVEDLSVISGQSIVDARTIGAITHESTGLIYWFVASDYFDGIYEYNAQEGTMVRVLQSNKVDPNTPSQLNFRKEYCITGVNYILGDNTDNYLFWTDDYNPPRRINIARAKAYNVNDYRIDMDIDVILEPPLYAPSIEPFIDTDGADAQASNMLDKFMYFAYRYKYIDGQYSSLSPFSAVAFGPKDYYYDYGVGNNKSMTNKYNSVRVSFETGNEFVEEVQLVVRDTKSINVSIVDTYSKPLLLIPDNFSFRITFTNNKIYAALPQEQVTRLFDNVPLLAKAQDVVGNRIAYGNYVQFQDIIDCNGDDISINFSLSLTSTEADFEDPKPTWRSDRDYEFGIVYLDDYGRMTTVLASQNNSINVPPVNAISANTISLRLSSSPPCWATHYRIVVKQAKKSYYNVFPTLFYSNGPFRYFLINESDKDKIRVNNYVIFKSTLSGPYLSNKKYKILELESKTQNFLSGGSNEVPGLYFKIKVDDNSEFNNSALFIYQKTSNGIGLGTSVAPTPVTNTFAAVEIAIHYGSGDPNALYSLPQNPNPDLSDMRYTVQIVDQNTFKYTVDPQAGSGWIYEPISTSSPIGLYRDSSFNIGCYIQFNQQTVYTVGDKWKINVRSQGQLGANNIIGNYFAGWGIPYNPEINQTSSYLSFPTNIGGFCVLQDNTFSVPSPLYDRPIFTGAIINIEIKQDSNNASEQAGIQTFISPSNYKNIEEWFVESGAFSNFIYYDNNGNNIGARSVTFRRGSSYVAQQFSSNLVVQSSYIIQGSYQDPVYMIIQGFGETTSTNINSMTVDFSIQQQEIPNICETVPVETDVDIYHELFQTYPIIDNKHVVLWDYDDYQFVDGGPFSGYTRLLQLDSERPKKRPHYFNPGDVVYVNPSAGPMPDGAYTVLSVENLYSIIVELGFPGAGGITPGTVKFDGSLEQDQGNIFTPAVIEINKPQSFNTEFSAWCWGNGLESDRIYDDFNETEKDFSVRVTTPVEDYKQVRSEASICYSGIFKQGSGINRMNEFNLSLSNFKYLDRDFGSIQKLYARNTDLVVFQQSKVSNVLYEKNVMFDSVGGGQVVSIPEVLGTQIPMAGEYGISNNPESFDNWGQFVFFTDARKGLVLQMENDQITEVSGWGMADFFRDIMRENPYTQKLGCYDPYLHKYILAFNDQKVVPCKLTLSRYSYKGPSTPFNVMAFLISTDSAWTISVQNNGYGTNWVSNYATSGFGPQNIFINVAQNNTGFNRFITFVVSYCDGLTQEFVLNQAKGKRGDVVLTVFNNPTPVIKG
jgi:hypothetical protein